MRLSIDDSLQLSLIDRLAALPDEQRREASPACRPSCWPRRSTPGRSGRGPTSSHPPGAWRVWLLRRGRGAGKTRAGAEWVRAGVEAGSYRRIALVGRTWADVRDVMVEGESGILAVCPPWCYPDYQPSRRLLVWPNGAVRQALLGRGARPLRGPQHDAAWCDELASWQRPETWDNLMLGLRLGSDPRCVVTTTPRPTKLIRELIARADDRRRRRPRPTPTAPTWRRASSQTSSPPTRAPVSAARRSTASCSRTCPGRCGTTPSSMQLAALRGGAEAAPWQRVVVAVDPAVSCGEDCRRDRHRRRRRCGEDGALLRAGRR